MSRTTLASESEQSQPDLLGFWIFLMSDGLIFALLFAVYATQFHATDGGPSARQLFELGPAIIETVLLLISSFIIAMVSLTLEFQARRLRVLVGWLGLTLLLGLAFLAWEMRDFLHLIDQGATAQRSGFLSAFYALVCTHGLHVSAGCLWLILLLVQLKVFGLDASVRSHLRCLALFWHFLDVVWVAIFSVVYLSGVTG